MKEFLLGRTGILVAFDKFSRRSIVRVAQFRVLHLSTGGRVAANDGHFLLACKKTHTHTPTTIVCQFITLAMHCTHQQQQLEKELKKRKTLS
jgi:hypothetical protein